MSSVDVRGILIYYLLKLLFLKGGSVVLIGEKTCLPDEIQQFFFLFLANT